MNPKLFREITHSRAGRAIYVYDLDQIENRVQALSTAFGSAFKIHFAMKANHFPAILKVVREAGGGVDVVSGGEIKWALEHGFKPEQIVFSGIGKSTEELEFAIGKGVKQINVESEPELERIFNLTHKLGQTARVALRVNPDVEAATHPYIRTGLKENKFGIDFETCERLLEQLAAQKNVVMVGCSLHIGSQIRDITPFREAVKRTLGLYTKWQSKLLSMQSIDVGGGLGMDYQATDTAGDFTLLKEYASTMRAELDPWLKSKKLAEVVLEPGRWIVARAGTLLAQVEYVKRTADKNFLIVNTGMHHLIRPMLYQAFHRIECVGREYSESLNMFDVVGPICESTDTLGRERMLPADVKEGDWIAIYDAGAYGAVMMNDYNLQARPLEIAIREGKVQ
jgi:diaminopimelate decarboxylase